MTNNTIGSPTLQERNTGLNTGLNSGLLYEVSLADKFLYQQITVDILRAAGHGTSKAAVMIQVLLNGYVENRDLYPDGNYPCTRVVLAEKLHTSIDGVRKLLTRLQAHQEKRQCTLITWEVSHYRDECNRWRTEPTSFNLTALLDIWIQVERDYKNHPLAESNRYQATWATAKRLVGQIAWDKPRVKYDRNASSRIAEDIKRTLNNASRTGVKENFRSYVEKFLEDFQKAANEKEKELGSIYGEPSGDKVN